MSGLRENAQPADETERLRNEIAQRDAELAVIGSVQQAVGAALDFQAIVDVVGDELRKVFATGDLSILWWDEAAGHADWLYSYEHGVRLHDMPPVRPRPGGYYERLLRERRTMVFASVAEQRAAGMFGVPGTDIGRSIVIVPMVSGGRFIGNVFVENHERDDAFGPSDVRLIETVTASMTVALLNARLFDETQRLLKETAQRNAELAVITRIQQGMAATLEFQGIVDVVGDTLREMFRTDNIVVQWLDRRADLVRSLYAYEHGERVQPAPFAPTWASPLTQAMRAGRTLSLRDRAEMRALRIEHGLSGLWVPLLVGGELLGQISLMSFERESAFDDDAVRLLTTVAASLGVALENARLFDETQRLLKETEQRNAELAVINRIQEGMAAELSFQAIVDLVGDKLRDVFASGNVGIHWWDETTGLAHPLYVYEHGVRFQIGPFKPGGAAARILRERATIVAGTRDEQATEGFFTAPGSDQSLSVVGVPIVGSDRVIGKIVLEDHDREHAFGESDIRLLQTVAASMGVALENARLFDETQRLLKETEQRAAEMAVINSIQQGMSGSLDFQTIVEMVGTKLCDVLGTKDIGIRWFDHDARRIDFLFELEHGTRIEIPSETRTADQWARMSQRRETIVCNTAAETAARGTVPGTDTSLSSVEVRIIGGHRMLGSIIVESFEREHAFGDAEVRLLQTVAASMGVALENARLFDETQRLLKETEARNAELAVINSIQQGVGAELNFQAIVDLVGDKLREVFATGDLMITWRDEPTAMRRILYSYEHGVRHDPAPVPDKLQRPIDRALLQRRAVLVRNRTDFATLELHHFEGTDQSLSSVFVPMFAGDRFLGTVILENYEREDAFSDSDVRLLETVAAGMGVALENARLFAETQRLLKETEQRAAELAIINSVQEGLAAKLEMQAIYDLVGDKVRDIFDAQVVLLGTFDHARDVEVFNYAFEKGRRLETLERPINRTRRELIDTRQPIYHQSPDTGTHRGPRQLDDRRQRGPEVGGLRTDAGRFGGAGLSQHPERRSLRRLQRRRPAAAADPRVEHERRAGKRAAVRRDAAACGRARHREPRVATPVRQARPRRADRTRRRAGPHGVPRRHGLRRAARSCKRHDRLPVPPRRSEHVDRVRAGPGQQDHRDR